jgi:ketosteroid isomerase-like protein
MNDSAIFRFLDYFRAFEATMADDDWGRLAPLLAPDAVYEIEGAPFACRIEGRDAIIEALRKSVSGLDRRLDDRSLEIVSASRLGADACRVDLIAGYARTGAPQLRFPVSMECETRSGEIVRLTDVYDPDLAAGAVDWLIAHGEGLDPTYV